LLLLLETWLLWPLPSSFNLRKGRALRSLSFLHQLSLPLSRDRYALFFFNYFGPFPQCLAHPLFLKNLDLSELLAFDPASIGSAILEADDPPLDLTSTANQLLRMKNLLLGLIDALIQDSSTVKQILDEVNSQLPVSLQVKLLPAGYLPSFRAKVAEARHRIETRRSQSLLRTIIAEMCQSVNKKKAALDAKVDTSASAQRLHLLEIELEDLEAKVRATR
jgi:hypothetical protein